jgi:FeS assembly SUF system protein
MPDQPHQSRPTGKALPVLPSSGKVKQLKAESAARPAAATGSPPAPPDDDLRAAVIDTLKTVYDPEIPLNIYDLGLVYDVSASPDGRVHVRMTLTTPGCPVAGTLPGEIQRKIQAIPGVASAEVELVWDPPWTKDRMSEAALLELGLL